jgi:Subtilase family
MEEHMLTRVAAAIAMLFATHMVIDLDAAALHNQVKDGTLLRNHGVVATCDVCDSRIVTAALGSTTPLATPVPTGYGADEIAAAYHLPAASVGTAGTIAIIDGGAYPHLESDLGVYRKQYGLSECTVANGCLKITDYKGGPPLRSEAPLYETLLSEETSMDVDMASAACPACEIVVVQAPAEDFFISAGHPAPEALPDIARAVTTAIALGANSVSMSFGYPSDPADDTGAVSKALSHPGVALVASSGDSGYQGNQHNQWPENLSSVISVGGTAVYEQDTGYLANAWNQAGSGCEKDLPPANGQPAAVAAYCGGHRASTDVSAVADPATGVAAYDTYGIGGWFVGGGTSSAAPLIAAMYARGGHTSKVDGPNTLYTAPAGAFTDVDFGQNAAAHSCQVSATALCVSGKGWDGPTGVGTPNGLAGF